MILPTSTTEYACPRREIAAYLDGDLSAPAELNLDLHLANCSICAFELNEQKKLICILDGALFEESEIEVPANFTKIVVANAQGGVSGLRHPGERFRALFVCSILFLLVLLGLGNETQTVVKTFVNFSEQIFAIGGFLWHFAYDFALGTAIVLRFASSQFLFNSGASIIFLFLILLILLLFLSKLFFRFNRA